METHNSQSNFGKAHKRGMRMGEEGVLLSYFKNVKFLFDVVNFGDVA